MVVVVVFKQVHQVATDQVFETFSHLGHKKSLPALRNAAASGSSGQLESLANVFTQDAKRLQEVSEQWSHNLDLNNYMYISCQGTKPGSENGCPKNSVTPDSTLLGGSEDKI